MLINIYRASNYGNEREEQRDIQTVEDLLDIIKKNHCPVILYSQDWNDENYPAVTIYDDCIE